MFNEFLYIWASFSEIRDKNSSVFFFLSTRKKKWSPSLNLWYQQKTIWETWNWKIKIALKRKMLHLDYFFDSFSFILCLKTLCFRPQFVSWGVRMDQQRSPSARCFSKVKTNKLNHQSKNLTFITDSFFSLGKKTDWFIHSLFHRRKIQQPGKHCVCVKIVRSLEQMTNE